MVGTSLTLLCPPYAAVARRNVDGTCAAINTPRGGNLESIVQGPIAQAAALVVFGNDVLRGHQRENFWPDATVFKFCKAVRFVALSGERAKLRESPFAKDPMQWIARLQDEGT